MRFNTNSDVPKMVISATLCLFIILTFVTGGISSTVFNPTETRSHIKHNRLDFYLSSDSLSPRHIEETIEFNDHDAKITKAITAEHLLPVYRDISTKQNKLIQHATHYHFAGDLSPPC